ncbi:MAG: oligosaccharide flippase family protein [Planctomycetes bacterium]|nr:oligosaccharide flippase family protein [Planctomycetota bacterium]
MASEAKRGLIRIAANYTRVFTVIVLGLVVVRLLLRGTGTEGWALISLLGAATGLTAMTQEVVVSSLIRELGVVYHRGNDDHFRSTYNAALAISSVIAVLTAALCFGLLLVLPLLEIPAELLPAARWLVAARGAQAVALILLAAPFSMYKVTERMVAFNAWTIANRFGYLIAALVVLWQGIDDAGQAVTLYVVLSAVLVTVTLLVASILMAVIDRRLVPAPFTITRDALKSILHVGAWNGAATVATSLHHRLSQVIMNLAFGLWGNLVLGLASHLTGAVKQLAVGMTEGLDAVSTRLSTTSDDGAIRSLMRQSTRLHGFATFPVAIGVAMLAEPGLNLWVGNRLDDSQTTLAAATALIRIMALGMASWTIADGWIRILYGAGHVRCYAPLVIAGGIANPLLAGLLLLVLPESVRYTAVCWSFSIVLFVVHGILVPFAGARALGMTPGQVLSPLLRPLIVAVACSPILLPVFGHRDESLVMWLSLAIGAYAVVYTAACILFVMNGHERTRFTRAALRRLPMAAGR